MSSISNKEMKRNSRVNRRGLSVFLGIALLSTTAVLFYSNGASTLTLIGEQPTSSYNDLRVETGQKAPDLISGENEVRTNVAPDTSRLGPDIESNATAPKAPGPKPPTTEPPTTEPPTTEPPTTEPDKIPKVTEDDENPAILEPNPEEEDDSEVTPSVVDEEGSQSPDEPEVDSAARKAEIIECVKSAITEITGIDIARPETIVASQTDVVDAQIGLYDKVVFFSNSEGFAQITDAVRTQVVDLAARNCQIGNQLQDSEDQRNFNAALDFWLLRDAGFVGLDGLLTEDTTPEAVCIRREYAAALEVDLSRGTVQIINSIENGVRSIVLTDVDNYEVALTDEIKMTLKKKADVCSNNLGGQVGSLNQEA